MLVHIDGHRQIGQRHVDNNLPCQDACVYDIRNDNWIMAVSDGCSGDGKAKTERGSAILCDAAKQLWLTRSLANKTPFDTGDMIWSLATVAAAKGRFNLMDMSATLMIAVPDTGHVRVIVWGDGVIAWRYAEGKLQVKELAWAFNRPPYIVYRQDNLAMLKLRIMMDEESGQVISHPTESFIYKGIEDGIDGVEWTLPWVDKDGHRLVELALFTDGVCQVPNQKPFKVVTDLMADHGTGPFMRRSIKQLMQDKTPETSPGDDLTGCCAHFIWDENP